MLVMFRCLPNKQYTYKKGALITFISQRKNLMLGASSLCKWQNADMSLCC